MVTEAAVRELLDKALRPQPPLSEQEWNFLHAFSHTEDLLGSPDDRDLVRGVVDTVKKARAGTHSAQPAGSTDPARSLPAHHAATVGDRSAAFTWALSENVAEIADRDPDVESFRTAYLPNGRPFDWENVEAWVAQQVQQQPAEIRRARVVVPAGWEPGQALDSTNAEILTEYLHYIVPDHDHVKIVLAAPGGVLSRLRRLSESLAVAHGWREAQATTWVLTGITPVIGLIYLTEGRAAIRHSMWMAWSERITLDVHPAASPDEVAEAYKAARQRLDRQRTRGARVRSQSARHLVLAGFIARRNDRTWDETRIAWNRWIVEHKEYADLKHYDSARTFRRDASLARNRVLYRGYYIANGKTKDALDNSR